MGGGERGGRELYLGFTALGIKKNALAFLSSNRLKPTNKKGERSKIGLYYLVVLISS